MAGLLAWPAIQQQAAVAATMYSEAQDTAIAAAVLVERSATSRVQTPADAYSIQRCVLLY